MLKIILLAMFIGAIFLLGKHGSNRRRTRDSLFWSTQGDLAGSNVGEFDGKHDSDFDCDMDSSGGDSD